MTMADRINTLETWLDNTFAGLRHLLLWIGFIVGTLWAAGAIYVDAPFAIETNTWLSIGWLIFAGILLLVGRLPGKRILHWLWFFLFLFVLVAWLQKAPSNDRPWRADWAKESHVTLHRGGFTFHNVRNFEYDDNDIIAENWESRTFNVTNLRGVDYFHDAFGGDLLAHPILSFDFGPEGRIALSIETRREVGESFSEIGGFFKMFELQYIWGDERDLIRVRTNIRNEPVHLYRTSLPREKVILMLLDSIRTTNMLKKYPRFYNVITANCTTSLLAQTMELRHAPFDIRMLANGRLDELIFEKGGFVTPDIPFTELRQRTLINEAAKLAHDDPEFSQRIRVDRPGFEQPSD